MLEHPQLTVEGVFSAGRTLVATFATIRPSSPRAMTVLFESFRITGCPTGRP